MPTGILGRTIIERKCFNDDCGKMFQVVSGNRRICCSSPCSMLVRGRRAKGNSKWSVNRIVERKKEEEREELDCRREHLHTMFGVEGTEGDLI